MCEYCKKEHTFANDWKEHLKLHILEESDQHGSQCNLNTSSGNQLKFLKDKKQKDTENYK